MTWYITDVRLNYVPKKLLHERYIQDHCLFLHVNDLLRHFCCCRQPVVAISMTSAEYWTFLSSCQVIVYNIFLSFWYVICVQHGIISAHKNLLILVYDQRQIGLGMNILCVHTCIAGVGVYALGMFIFAYHERRLTCLENMFSTRIAYARGRFVDMYCNCKVSVKNVAKRFIGK